MSTRLLALLCIFALLTACDKDDNTNPESPLNDLPGTIYFDWATEGVLQIDMATGERSLLLPYSTKRDGWDVSRDTKYLLQSEHAPDQDYDATRFAITHLQDGTLIDQFDYYAEGGSIATGTLSPNGNLIAINPTFEEGIVVTDRQGNKITHIYGINEVKVDDKPIWMPDNSLLFKHGSYLIKTNPDFTEASVVKQLDFADWGMVAASHDGRRIAFVADNHIWLMNADGSDMKQVTTSRAAEAHPQFSPDGKYLLIGTDFHRTGPFGHLWYLKGIPADGNQYQVDDGEESAGVVPIKLPGQDRLEAGSGLMYWR